MAIRSKVTVDNLLSIFVWLSYLLLWAATRVLLKVTTKGKFCFRLNSCHLIIWGMCVRTQCRQPEMFFDIPTGLKQKTHMITSHLSHSQIIPYASLWPLKTVVESLLYWLITSENSFFCPSVKTVVIHHYYYYYFLLKHSISTFMASMSLDFVSLRRLSKVSSDNQFSLRINRNRSTKVFIFFTAKQCEEAFIAPSKNSSVEF